MRTLPISSRRSSLLGGLATSLLFALTALVGSGCTVDEADDVCIAACPAPLTITVHGTENLGPPDVSTNGLRGSCSQSTEDANTSICSVGEDAGDYEVTLSAPGYQPKTVRADVDTSNDACSCGYDAESIEVTLEETPVAF
jgi:hypothetical protein